MPVHDWSRTYAGAFHHLHVTWLVELARALNQGLLPPGYYALGEQVIGGAVPDVLTLERAEPARGSEGRPHATSASSLGSCRRPQSPPSRRLPAILRARA